MNYYEHHLGDYLRDTAHLTLTEHGAYRCLLDLYYIREKPLPLDLKEICRLVRATSTADRKAVDAVLHEFFKRGADGWSHSRCDREIARASLKKSKAQASANARWNASPSHASAHSDRNANASPDAMRTHSEGNAPKHQAPEASNQTPKRAAVPAPPPQPEPPLPRAEPESATAKPANPPPASVAEEWSAKLRALGVRCQPDDPRLLAWIGEGIPLSDLLGWAAIARERKGGAPVPMGYLAAIVADPPKPAEAKGPPWWSTDEATDAKGRELGLYPAPAGIGYPEYRALLKAELERRAQRAPVPA